MRTIKRATAMLMAAVMCISFGGCGKKKEASKEEVVPYKLTQLLELDRTLDNIIYQDGTIYGTYTKYDDNGDNETHGIIKYDFTSDSKSEAGLDLTSGYVNNMYINAEGNLIVNAEKYTSDTLPGEITYDEKDAFSTTISEEDIVNEPEDDKEEREEEMGNQVSEVTYVFSTALEIISCDESEINEEDNENGDEGWISDTIIDNDGNTIEAVGALDGGNYIRFKNLDGNVTKKIELGDDIYVRDIIKLEDGTVLVSIWGDQGQEIYTINKEEGKLGDKYIDADNLYTISGVYAGKENSVLLNLDKYLYVCDGESKKMTKVLNYLDNDLLCDNIQFVCAVEEDSYAVVVNDYENDKSEIDLLSKQSKEDVVVKEEIHLAAFGLDDDIKQKVIQFNRTNDKYRIVIDEYFDKNVYNTDTGYEDAFQRFNADILSGSADIIDLNSLDISKYASKGIIEDLLPYMEKDNDISVDDFVESIVNAYMRDGKLYSLPRDFMLDAFAGPTSKVGTETKWTLSEFIEFVKGLPDGMDVLNEVSSDYLLTMMIRCDIDEYVNWLEGTCNFNTDEFVQLLELCSNYKSSEDLWAEYEDMDDEDWENEPSEITKIKNNKLALYNALMTGVDDYLALQQTFDEEFTIKGYPTKEKNGILVTGSGGTLGICSKSNYKDVAWEFIKQMYSYDEISNSMRSFPIRKDALDNYFEELKNRPLDTAPDGTQYYTEIGMGDIELYIGNPTDEDINQIKDIINKADTVANYANNEIFSIIEEESESFFKGEKTAKEVAEIIQSRVSIYVKENN